MNPFLLDAMVKEKHREMLEEAQQQRLLAAYDAMHPSLWVRFHVILGNFFIRFGERLKQRYSSQFLFNSEFCSEQNDNPKITL
ncbi:MAG: hypothetical protein GY799_01645 [Desulfobulbaceae bacterium]|nr:hypothetical protein [Desulfobulbaceae bacterium]